MKKPDWEQLRQGWLIFFLLGLVMLNYPFLQTVNSSQLIFGFPLLWLYFFVGWPLSILVVYLFTRTVLMNTEPDEHTDTQEEEPET